MSNEKAINFMGHRYQALVISVLLLITSIGSLAINGLNFGLDFTGGTLIEVLYEDAADLNQVRSTLESEGYNSAVVQHFGAENDVLIRLQQSNDNKLGDKLLALLRSTGEKVELQRIEYVGPQVGDELREQGGLAMLFALAVVMVYVALRFQLKFSVGAVTALIHDVIITLGFFSLFQWEFDLTVLAALLAVIGYSLNDTIVVSDRIRENFRLLRKGDPVEVINISLTQTLGRTVITSLTTLIVLIVLFFTGGELINGFSLALIIGVVTGTYSSIYVAANALMLMHIVKEDLIIPEKEGEEFELP